MGMGMGVVGMRAEAGAGVGRNRKIEEQEEVTGGRVGAEGQGGDQQLAAVVVGQGQAQLTVGRIEALVKGMREDIGGQNARSDHCPRHDGGEVDHHSHRWLVHFDVDQCQAVV